MVSIYLFLLKYKYFIEKIEKMSLILIVDNREVKSQSDRDYIFKALIEKGLECEQGNLPIGDFLWVVQIKGEIII